MKPKLHLDGVPSFVFKLETATETLTLGTDVEQDRDEWTDELLRCQGLNFQMLAQAWTDKEEPASYNLEAPLSALRASAPAASLSSHGLKEGGGPGGFKKRKAAD